MGSERKIIPAADISRVLVVSNPANKTNHGSGPSGEAVTGNNNYNNKSDDDVGVNKEPPKKKRFVWTLRRHGKFVQAVNSIGFDKATPKKIMLAMNMPNELTREIVSSHWQKYRGKLIEAAEEEEHRITIIIPNYIAQIKSVVDQGNNNNGLTDTEIITSTERPARIQRQHHIGLGCNINGSTTDQHLQVEVSCNGRFLHDQSFDYCQRACVAQQLPWSHHHIMNSNFFGRNYYSYTNPNSTVGADAAAPSSEDRLQAAQRAEFVGDGSADSDPLEFTVVELIDNIVDSNSNVK